MDLPADGYLRHDVLSETIPELRSGAWRLLSCHVTHVRKQLRKRIVFCRMAYHDGAGKRSRTAEIVAKVYGSDRGARSLGALRQLWEAGFRPPARYRVPRPYGYSPKQGTLLQAMAPGATWGSFLQGGGPALATASARSAAWLVHLQNCPVTPEMTGWEGDKALMLRVARELVASFPGHAPRLEAAAARLLQRLQPEGPILVPSHGDYHPQNVFLTPAATTVIDFDTFALREPAFDVGYSIGQLLIMSGIRVGSFAPGARAALAFWRRYHLEGGALWPRVAAHVARAFLQSLHYELCVLRNNRIELLDLWLDVVEQWLASAGPGTLEWLGAAPGTDLLAGARKLVVVPAPQPERSPIREAA